MQRITNTMRRTLRTALAASRGQIHVLGAVGRWSGHRSGHQSGHWHSRALTVARVVWLAAAALALALYLAGLRLWLTSPAWSTLIPCPGALCQAVGPGAGAGPGAGQALATERTLADLHLSLGLVGDYIVALHLLVVVGYAALGVLIYLRRSRDPLALFVSLTLLVFGATLFDPEMGLLTVTSPGWQVPVGIVRFLGGAAFGAFLVVFPDGRFVPRWTAALAVAWALWVVPSYAFPGSPLDYAAWPAAASVAAWALFLGAMLWAQVYRYRRVSTPAQREQTKWVVLGFALAALGYFGRRLALVASAAAPQLSPQAALWDLLARTLLYLSLLVIPLCIAVAILRRHLFDVDLLIRRTLVYAALVATLAVLYEGATLIVVKGLLAFSGQENFPFEAALAFAVGTLAGPLHHRIERDITRVLYPRKYAVEHRLEELSKQLRREWGVVPRSEEWEEAAARRLARAWGAVRRRTAPARMATYIQDPLFP
ncbi:MAG TPA: hypothetical protein VGP82_15650 [Ktedonobacterales bacterium]|nr:hypothetical protein [Ktedonobacterales bacterium]